MIPFNKPFVTGNELKYIQDAIIRNKISGNGYYTDACEKFFEQTFQFKKILLTHSCTAALEMAAILIDIKQDDEIIIPSFTFTSTANAFLLRGAKVIFADCLSHFPNINHNTIEELITIKTKAIVVVHYGGVSCNIDDINFIAKKHNLIVIEDCAHAVDAYYKDKQLGSFGTFAAFSFHETKNISCGEGGMLVINDEKYSERAEIIWDKGTNRSAFNRGETELYSWLDIGSSFLPSELQAAYLYAQTEALQFVTAKRKKLWSTYFSVLSQNNTHHFLLPEISPVSNHNGSIFYIVCKDASERNKLIIYLKHYKIHSAFHYQPLHASPYFKKMHETRELIHTMHFSDCLLRLPLFYELKEPDIEYICDKIHAFYT